MTWAILKESVLPDGLKSASNELSCTIFLSCSVNARLKEGLFCISKRIRFFLLYFKDHLERWRFYSLCVLLWESKSFLCPTISSTQWIYPPPHSHIHLHALQRLVPCVLTCTHETWVFGETILKCAAITMHIVKVFFTFSWSKYLFSKIYSSSGRAGR